MLHPGRVFSREQLLDACARPATRSTARRTKVTERPTAEPVGSALDLLDHQASFDDDPDQPVGAAPSSCFGECGAKYYGGRFVACCDAHLNAGGASAYRRWADPVDREYREQYRVERLHYRLRGKSVKQGYFS